MRMVELGDFMVARGGSVNPEKFPHETFELHSIPSFDKGAPEILTGVEIGSPKQVVRPGDVLISKIVPHIRRAHVVPKKGVFRQIASGEWIVFRTSEVDNSYFRHFLLSDSFNREFLNTVAGVGGSLMRARPEFVKRVKMPLPELEEQRRIAAILDKADEIRAKRQQVLDHLDHLKMTVLVEEIGTLPANGVLADSVQIITGPFGSMLHKEDYVEGGVAVVNPSQIKNGKLVLDSSFSVSDSKAAELNQYRLRVGDIVLGRRGEMGRAGIVTAEHEGALCGTGSMILRSSAILPEVLHAHLTSRRSRDYLERNALGATLPNLNQRIVGALPMLSVGKSTQHQIKSRLERVSLLRAALQKTVAYETEAQQALSTKAFRGEL